MREIIRTNIERMNRNRRINITIDEVDLVGVHVRRTDHLEHENQFGYQKLSRKYYIQAMNIYKRILRNPVFIIVSDDVQWVQTEINQNIFHHSFTGK